jgi:CO/xanthine dehydrogenase FAD-binding subunit
VKPRPFTYHAPTSVDEALVLLAEHGMVLAGGQSLTPLRHLSMIERPALAELVHARLAGAELPAVTAASCGCAEVRA